MAKLVNTVGYITHKNLLSVSLLEKNLLKIRDLSQLPRTTLLLTHSPKRINTLLIIITTKPCLDNRVSRQTTGPLYLSTKEDEMMKKTK